MMLKVIGQLLLATSFMHMLPADASYFEWQVGSAEEAHGAPQIAQVIGISAEQFPVAKERERFPVKVDTDSYGIVTSARSVVVQDAESGMLLLAEHPHDIRSIGSVTKLMTALVFLEQNPNLHKMVELEPSKDLVTGGRIYLAFFDPLELEDILGAALVGSDNTATQSLVRFSGMEEEAFIDRMNEKAQELGMMSTTFVDPTGILSENMSTAEDLVRLLMAAEGMPAIQHFMQMAHLTIQHESGIIVQIENTNGLLQSYLNEGDYRIQGGKTGFLPQAGYVLATTVERAHNRVHVVIMGADSKDAREQEAKGLATWAFRVFRWPGQN